MGNDNGEIMAIHQAWIDAERKGDVEAMLSLCSADIRFFPPYRCFLNKNLLLLQENDYIL